MLENYLQIAWRNIVRNKVYSAISILGLAVGLAMYAFSSLLAAYENNHDAFMPNIDRVYFVGAVAAPTANFGVGAIDGNWTAVGPLLAAEAPEIEAIARSYYREFLISIDDRNYYQQIGFTDPDFTKIFNLSYIEGDASALTDPAGVLITESLRRKLFGNTPALGRTIMLDHKTPVHVTAVVRDLPLDSHLNSSLVLEHKFSMMAPFTVLRDAVGYKMEGDWNDLSLGNLTYVQLPANRDAAWLQRAADAVFEGHAPKTLLKIVSGFKVYSLHRANTFLWEAVGLPVIDTIALLGFLVLVVAIVNYTNIATAQSLRRTREVGLRKTMGASRRQLLVQFMTESVVIAALAMVIAFVAIEVAVPVFNSALGKGLAIHYAATLPWLVVTTLLVGLISGAYPAYVITRVAPANALRSQAARGRSLFRSILLAVQFTIAIFMLSMALVMFLQNKKLEESSQIYPKQEIEVLRRVNVEAIKPRHETLRSELLKLPGVVDVSYSSMVPFEQSNSTAKVGAVAGDEAQTFLMNQVNIDTRFLATYDIPLLEGRNVSDEVADDTWKEDVVTTNVILNELALKKLGLTRANGLGHAFYTFPEDEPARTLTIVGIMPDQNFQGLHNQIKPTMFYMNPKSADYLSVRMRPVDIRRTVTGIDEVWARLVPDYPIQDAFLDDTFQKLFKVFAAMSKVLVGFALVALGLSFIGLFGLAAFMAANRTREIGIRKVMGANSGQIVRMLLWQFSTPVFWGLLVAVPVSYLASETYLNFFADRIGQPAVVVLTAGVAALGFSWLVVVLHAYRVASVTPIRSLRYE